MIFNTRNIAVFCTLLIAVGFTLSGFHYHDERNPDAEKNEVSIVHEFDYCLLCEGISSDQPVNSHTAEGFITELPEIIVEQDSVFSSRLTLVQNSRAPPQAV
jgi:hypothetical protein